MKTELYARRKQVDEELPNKCSLGAARRFGLAENWAEASPRVDVLSLILNDISDS